MNNFINAMKENGNFTLTENGATTRTSTNSSVYDMFALGGSMRNRSDEDILLMFRNAYAEDPVYALRCLFYLRDIREGQGERRFFRLCMNWLASYDTEAAKRNMQYIKDLGRIDDLYCFIDTPLEEEMFKYLKKLVDQARKEYKI